MTSFSDEAFSCIESGLGLEKSKDESSKGLKYVLNNRSSIHKAIITVTAVVSCLLLVSGVLYSSRTYISYELSIAKVQLNEKEFHEDIRTTDLFLDFAATLANQKSDFDKIDIFLDMEKEL